jgi:hypothetical protein
MITSMKLSFLVKKAVNLSVNSDVFIGLFLCVYVCVGGGRGQLGELM